MVRARSHQVLIGADPGAVMAKRSGGNLRARSPFGLGEEDGHFQPGQDGDTARTGTPDCRTPKPWSLPARSPPTPAPKVAQLEIRHVRDR